MDDTPLNHRHAHTLQQIFQHPVSDDLEWIDVAALVNPFGTASEEASSYLVLTLCDISDVFHPSQGAVVIDARQVMQIRRFLERACATPPPEQASPQGDATVKEQDSRGTNCSRGQTRLDHERNMEAEQRAKTQQNEPYDRGTFLAKLLP